MIIPLFQDPVHANGCLEKIKGNSSFRKRRDKKGRRELIHLITVCFEEMIL
jgi:hypothetical protein